MTYAAAAVRCFGVVQFHARLSSMQDMTAPSYEEIQAALSTLAFLQLCAMVWRGWRWHLMSKGEWGWCCEHWGVS